MVEEAADESGDAPTRRALIATSAITASGFLSGCLNGGGDPASATDAAATSATTDENNHESTATDGPYTVSMAPMGAIEFDSVPERWIAYDGGYADMGVALGHADGLAGIGGIDRYYTSVYDELPGVSVDRERLERHPEVRAKEEFYAIDADVHLYDPQMLVNWFDWNQSDIDEISENVAPFYGNLIFRRSDDWHDYRYYTLYQSFERVATLFKERPRFEAFKALHDEFVADVQSQLPAPADRPNVFLTYEGTDEPETFSPYRLRDDGTSKKQWQDLGVGDALTGTDIENLSTTNRGELDYENLLEIDPDVILVRGHERKSASEFRDVVLAYMQEHPVGGELTAVKNGRVYRGGYLYQGPIHNLFLTERGAKQMYPDVFGDVTGGDDLFDRRAVADVVNGEF